MSLGLHVRALLISHTGSAGVYEFSVAPGDGGVVLPNATGARGRLSVDLATGAFELLEASADDPTGERIYPRACVAVEREWRGGELPNEVWWEA